MKILGSDSYWVVQASSSKLLLRVERSAELFESALSVAESFDMIHRAISELPVNEWGIIVDLRKVTPGTNPEIEKAFAAERGPLLKKFRKQAILLRGIVGRMQVNRVLRNESKLSMMTFNDEDEAEAWALSPE